jgi:hypothetical protein
MDGELAVLLGTAASIALIHTLIGPDHYVPFIAMARARDWTRVRTLSVTLACGLGHVAGSVVVGTVGIGLGLAVGGVNRFESARGDVAGWLLLGLGLAYAVWGLRRALRNRPHSHWHAHGDGTVHRHTHVHHGSHQHVHAGRRRVGSAAGSGEGRRSLTPWVLFTIFVLGPCEPLIPILMYPAAQQSWMAVGLVSFVFAVCTLTAMTGMVLLGLLGASRIPFGLAERYAQVMAGLALVACGAAITLGL